MRGGRLGRQEDLPRRRSQRRLRRSGLLAERRDGGDDEWGEEEGHQGTGAASLDDDSGYRTWYSGPVALWWDRS
jgi:hypothetical protein